MINKKLLYRMLVVVGSFFLLTICFLNTNYFIRGQEWKHRNGSSVGDWIGFDNTPYAVTGRTIYKNYVATGKVFFCLGKMLIIKEMATGEKGYYINKTNF